MGGYSRVRSAAVEISWFLGVVCWVSDFFWLNAIFLGNLLWSKYVTYNCETFYTVFWCYNEAKKKIKSVARHFSLRFPIYVIINPVSLSFLHRMLYLFKCYEIYTVVYSGHIQATVIFVEFAVHFCYLFIISPNYLNKLIKAWKEFI